MTVQFEPSKVVHLRQETTSHRNDFLRKNALKSLVATKCLCYNSVLSTTICRGDAKADPNIYGDLRLEVLFTS